MRALTSLLVLMSGGCNWISNADIEARRGQMDDDGDGFVQAKDCNDKDAKISPSAKEIWYDGIDGDCAGDDDYDADKDGYVANDYAGLVTEGLEGTGSLPGGDCDDAEFLVNPAGTDSWYDGIDTDCSGNDDHDKDGDGFVSVNREGLPTKYVEGSGNLPGNDCDDELAEVNPDAVDEAYDGADTDCSGNDDYDQDADGFVPTEHVNQTTRYVQGSGGLPPGDCWDLDPVTHPDLGDAALTAADIHPGATEQYGDGIDQDCAGGDDFDSDLDGFADPAYEGIETYDSVGPIEGTGELPATDCDDTNGAIYPAAVETITSSTDFDCDGNPATFILGDLAEHSPILYALDWHDPAADLVFDSNSTEVYLSVRAPHVEVTRESPTGPLSPTEYRASALAFGVSRSDPGGEITEFADWWKYTGPEANLTYNVTDGHDFIAEDDALYGLVGLKRTGAEPQDRILRLNVYRPSDGARFGLTSTLSSSTTDDLPDFESMSLFLDSDDVLHAVACESSAGVLHYLQASKATLASNNYDERQLVEEAPLQNCEIRFDTATDTGTLLGRNGSTLETWSFAPGGDGEWAFAQEDVEEDLAAAEVEMLRDGTGEWTVMADILSRSILIIDPTGAMDVIATVDIPTSLHAAFVAGGSDITPDIVITYTNNSDTAYFLRFDTSTGTAAEYELAPGFVAQDAAVWIDTVPATGEEFVLAAVAGESALVWGWAWY